MARRPRETLSQAIAEQLHKAELRDAYEARPAYQRNDYLRWIKDAKTEPTREKRTAQMLEELRRGHVYMGMAWRGARSRAKKEA